MSAPSSSRIDESKREAMSSNTERSIVVPSDSAFFIKMAMRVSKSGGWMSVISPPSKRVRRRSSSVVSCFGGRSEDKMICLFAWCSALKVWKNSSCVDSLPSRN